MNSELEAYFTAAEKVPGKPPDSKTRETEKADFAARFLATADSVLRPVLESTAETLRKHGYGAAVDFVRDQSGSDPNTFPYLILHFSSERCPPSDLAYVYTLAGASVSFICRRSDLCAEVVIAHPAARGIERRVNFSTLALAELTRDRANRIVTDAVRQIIRS